MKHRAVAALAAGVVAIPLLSGAPAAADERVPFTLDVADARARVGEEGTVKAVMTAPEGFKFTKVYRHRIIDLSAEDGGVEFRQEVVPGAVEDDTLVFEIGVTPTAAGEHPINGIIRVSFNSGKKSESKSVPLIATVTGTQ